MDKLLKILLLATFLNSLSFILITPVFQYPDEQAHFAQVQDIAEIGYVPPTGNDTSKEIASLEQVVGTSRDGAGNNKYTYHPEYKTEYNGTINGPQEQNVSQLPKTTRQEFTKDEATLNPPLYYFLSSLVYRTFSWGDIFTRIYAIRILSASIFVLTVFITYKIGQIVFVKNKYLPVSLAVMIAFTPMLVHATSGILPDTLNILLFSSFLYICLKITTEGFSVQKLLLAAVVIALGAATRQNFLITLFILPLPLIYEFLQNKKTRKSLILAGVVFAFGIYILSFFVPAMDFIRRFDYPESSGKNPQNPLAALTFTQHLIWTLKNSVSQVWPWFWGIYKWLSLSLPPEVYQIINRLIPVAIFGLIIKTYYLIKKRDIKNGKIFLFLALSVFIYVLFLTTFDFLFRKNNGYSFGIQGRYYFPVIVPAFALLLAGFNQVFEFTKKYSNCLLVLLVTLFFALNLTTLVHIANSYYDTTSLQSFINHASNYKPIFLKGEILLFFLLASLVVQVFFLTNYARNTILAQKSLK